MKTTKKLTALMAAFIFAFAFAVVKPVKVQAAEYYNVKVTGGFSYSPWGLKDFNVEAGTTKIIVADESMIPEGKYVEKFVDKNNGFELKSESLTMPGHDLNLEAVYADAKDYTIDLTSGTADVPVNLGYACPFIDNTMSNPFFEDAGTKLDLNNDGTDDVEVTANDGSTITYKSLDSGITTGKLDTVGHRFNFVFKFAPTGNNGGGNTPANEGGATTGETPAAPAKADPKKAPKTGESNAFVLSMLGIIAVAGMGLYVGKKQEN